MPLFRRLATIATAAEAARRYAKSHPEQTARFVDQAANFVDKQTKGRYTGQITGAAQKAKSVAGIRPTSTPDAGSNGYTPGFGKHDDQASGNGARPGAAPVYGQEPGKPTPGAPAV